MTGLVFPLKLEVKVRPLARKCKIFKIKFIGSVPGGNIKFFCLNGEPNSEKKKMN